MGAVVEMRGKRKVSDDDMMALEIQVVAFEFGVQATTDLYEFNQIAQLISYSPLSE